MTCCWTLLREMQGDTNPNTLIPPYLPGVDNHRDERTDRQFYTTGAAAVMYKSAKIHCLYRLPSQTNISLLGFLLVMIAEKYIWHLVTSELPLNSVSHFFIAFSSCVVLFNNGKWVKISLWQAMKAHGAVWHWGFHIFEKIDSQMVARLPALRADRPLPTRWLLALISIRDWVDSKAILQLDGCYPCCCSIALKMTANSALAHNLPMFPINFEL
jgi:hypothetical protein